MRLDVQSGTGKPLLLLILRGVREIQEKLENLTEQIRTAQAILAQVKMFACPLVVNGVDLVLSQFDGVELVLSQLH